MEIGMLLDENVVHKSFGKGVINSADGKYLDVEFFKGNKKKQISISIMYSGLFEIGK